MVWEVPIVWVDVENIGVCWFGAYGVKSLDHSQQSMFPLRLEFVPNEPLTREHILAAFWQARISPIAISSALRPPAPSADPAWYLPIRRSFRRVFGRKVRYSDSVGVIY